MAFNFMRFFNQKGKNADEQGEKTLSVRKQRCPQNHRCPSVSACPFGALSQVGYAAPVVDYAKCTGCGKCTRYCMPRALVIRRQ
ncbi:MAG: 4Fe-4S binding protein [Sphaerochaeta sp.]|nr:4Fe-4S binding protein [Spirochaetales bacterium]